MYQFPDYVYEQAKQRQMEIRQELADDRLIQVSKRNPVACAVPSHGFRFPRPAWVHQAWRTLLWRA